MDAILNYERSDEDDYYLTLGCDDRSTVEQINAEYKMRVLHCHPDKHPGDLAAAERFARLQTAKSVLSNPEEREKYDTWRRAGICMPYQQWRALRDNVHMSMHWAMKKQTDPMIESGGGGSDDRCDGKDSDNPSVPQGANETKSRIRQAGFSANTHWTREPASESLRRFRNYEI